MCGMRRHYLRTDIYSRCIQHLKCQHGFFFHFYYKINLKEESKNFASQMFPPGLFMVHDSATRGQYNISRKKISVDLVSYSL